MFFFVLFIDVILFGEIACPLPPFSYGEENVFNQFQASLGYVIEKMPDSFFFTIHNKSVVISFVFCYKCCMFVGK